MMIEFNRIEALTFDEIDAVDGGVSDTVAGIVAGIGLGIAIVALIIVLA